MSVADLAEEFEENGLNDVAEHLRTHGVAATRTWVDGEIERAREEDAALHHGEGWVLPNLEVARERLEEQNLLDASEPGSPGNDERRYDEED